MPDLVLDIPSLSDLRSTLAGKGAQILSETVTDEAGTWALQVGDPLSHSSGPGFRIQGCGGHSGVLESSERGAVLR